ncbi:uncharacterized protein UBRO_04274 [Ustilago bromivora]|uniref:Copper-fist domain-containing protein n=1 Tax=Ustilago bromivora TaxID=307758 RepID=A0A1K0H6N2_9BASI|nr:uncharacterized protein UBRO_04274 [Ustilago bromivora]SYW75333.1 uncharacterized protein UBRO2_00568 [Ustilago bromivora]
MTATTAPPSRPPSFLPYRYSESMLSMPRSGESSHTKTFTSSSSTSSTRDTPAPRMTFTISSPSSSRAADPASLAPATSPNSDEHHADPSTGGVKYACASCIRGHRTSSCTHKDGSKGPLYPIRSKGRPPTQCEICRKKRMESGRHVRCDCIGKKNPASTSSTALTSTTTASHPQKRGSTTNALAPILPSTTAPTSSRRASDCSEDARPAKRSKVHEVARATQAKNTMPARRISDTESVDISISDSSAYDNVLAPIRPPHAQHFWSLPSIHTAQTVARRTDGHSTMPQTIDPFKPRRSSTLSLPNLMNPCGCRSTGSCTCCSEQRQRKLPISPRQQASNLKDCDPSRCSCSGPFCRQAKRASPTRQMQSMPSTDVSTSKPATSSCCSDKGVSASTAYSIELLLQAVDMSTEFVPPPCGCGENCRCAGCLAKQGASAVPTHEVQRAPNTMTASSASPRTSPATMASRPAATTSATSAVGCDDCAACDLALERPSGIGAVDSWMEMQRNAFSPARNRSSSIESDQHRASSTVASANASRRTSQAEVAPLSEHAADRPIHAAVPTLHGGLLTSDSDKEGADQEANSAEVHAELVLVHPKCSACLKVVREKGVGVLSAAK